MRQLFSKFSIFCLGGLFVYGCAESSGKNKLPDCVVERFSFKYTEAAANWFGNCDSGLPNGYGELDWKYHDSETQYSMTFVGTMDAGMFHGAGSLTSFLESSEGPFGGFTTTEKSEGVFLHNELHGMGSRNGEVTSENGSKMTSSFSGQFVRDEFEGFGNAVRKVDAEFPKMAGAEFESWYIKYSGSLSEGGVGRIGYRNGDWFSGAIDPFYKPVNGVCFIKQKNLEVKCTVKSFELSSYAGEDCLVEAAKQDVCLKQINFWVE